MVAKVDLCSYFGMFDRLIDDAMSTTATDANIAPPARRQVAMTLHQDASFAHAVATILVQVQPPEGISGDSGLALAHRTVGSETACGSCRPRSPSAAVELLPFEDVRAGLRRKLSASLEHKKALLLNTLGFEGLLCYLRALEEEPKPGDHREISEDAYITTLTQLDQMFNPQQDPACVRTQFKFLRQCPDETTVEFIHEVH
ncbi:hypothetical protein HPB50_027899 [Hyalomma asiaticum]|nr:hypothetical protein HPB50_027899 [Hyalomma asiaticum]